MSRISVQVPLRWADMDAYGHVNNVNQVRLMEEARVMAFGSPSGTGEPVNRVGKIALFESVGAEILILVVDHHIRYISQLPYRDIPIRVELWVEKIKGASFELHYEFFDGHTDQLASRASTTMALTDLDGKILRLTPELKAGLAQFTDSKDDDAA
ncbi:MAG: acyl-CoA thioesterase [Galactobacter sp.]